MAMDESRDWLESQKVTAHLEALIRTVIDERPSDPYCFVEVLSRSIKESRPPAATCSDSRESGPGTRAVEASVAEILTVPEDESGPVAVCAVPDFMEDARMLSWAGLSYGEVESYQLMCSMRKLAFQEQDKVTMNSLRFWGKMLGTHADYYVVEVRRPEGDGREDEEENDDRPEMPGKPGANFHAYFVTNDLCSTWTLLPDVRPSHIQAARRIKRLLTGDLSATVVTHPYFPGKENVLLRAQIARISADTVVCMKGHLVADEDDPMIVSIDPEFGEGVTAMSLLQTSAWTHMQPHILRSGATVHPGVPEEDDEYAALMLWRAKLLAVIEADPELPVLRTLDVDGLEWGLKLVGDATLYANERPQPEDETPLLPVSSAMVVVRSLTWPGAVCVARRGYFVNLYVGYGLPSFQPDFFISAPPDVHSEPPDDEEQPEPSGELETEEEPKEDDDQE